MPEGDSLLPDLEFFTILGLGFLLGARHALDADHLVAVSTIVSRRPGVTASGFIGFCWGFGHTVVLLLVGLAVILLKVQIPEAVAQAFEFGIGVLLVGLGAWLGMSLYRERWHLHAHEHDGEPHVHLHSHRDDPSGQVHHAHGHWLQASIQPFLVGMAHGLAGSAALMLMVVSTVGTLWEGVAYILVFGLGSILGMVLLGALISLPFAASASLGRRAHVWLQSAACLASIGLGISMMVRVGLGG